MEFRTDKCSHINTEGRKNKLLGVNLCLNDLQIPELENDECYKYLGQDEDNGFNVLNKKRVAAEYLERVKKIWNSQLYACNKVLSHNIFVVLILTPTFGIIQCTNEKIDIKTRTISAKFP